MRPVEDAFDPLVDGCGVAAAAAEATASMATVASVPFARAARGPQLGQVLLDESASSELHVTQRSMGFIMQRNYAGGWVRVPKKGLYLRAWGAIEQMCRSRSARTRVARANGFIVRPASLSQPGRPEI